jgi:hypothetical protein
MSGPATPWIQSPTGRQKQIVTATRIASRALQEPSVKCREKCFSLDKPLSWKSSLRRSAGRSLRSLQTPDRPCPMKILVPDTDFGWR